MALLAVIFTQLNAGERVYAEEPPAAQGAPSYFFSSHFLRTVISLVISIQSVDHDCRLCSAKMKHWLGHAS